MNADFIKQAILNKFGIKSQAICDEVGLPVLVEWATTRFADIMEVKKGGNVVIYEVKSCIADFKADTKYHNYLDHCHLLYFVADKETIEYIAENVDPKIGLYKVYGKGYLECVRRARSTKLVLDSEKISNAILKKSNYRYLKFWRRSQLEPQS